MFFFCLIVDVLFLFQPVVTTNLKNERSITLLFFCFISNVCLWVYVCESVKRKKPTK